MKTVLSLTVALLLFAVPACKKTKDRGPVYFALHRIMDESYQYSFGYLNREEGPAKIKAIAFASKQENGNWGSPSDPIQNITFDYNNGLITGYSHYKEFDHYADGLLLGKATFTRDDQNRIIKSVYRSEDNGKEITSEFKYNNKNQLYQYSSSDGKGETLEIKEDGNAYRAKLHESTASEDLTIEYSYTYSDTRNTLATSETGNLILVLFSSGKVKELIDLISLQMPASSVKTTTRVTKDPATGSKLSTSVLTRTIKYTNEANEAGPIRILRNITDKEVVDGVEKSSTEKQFYTQLWWSPYYYTKD